MAHRDHRGRAPAGNGRRGRRPRRRPGEPRDRRPVADDGVDHVDAVVLTGGSAFGLAAADGVMAWLEERARGFRVGADAGQVVPIVPAAALFDLGRGGDFRARPDPGFGRLAAEAATADRPVPQGSAGAGTGAVAGGLAGGVGSASAVLPPGLTVAALVAVNSAGAVVDPADGTLPGVRAGLPGEFDTLRRPSADEVAAWADAVERGGRVPPFHTTLAVVATDAPLTPAQCSRLATAAHDGMARAIDPVHTYLDGDIAFALATGTGVLPGPALPVVNGLLGVAARVVSRAVAHAVLAATGRPGTPSYRETFPSASL